MSEKVYGKELVSKDELEASYLPLSGGTMTGPIAVAPGDNNGINAAYDGSFVSICGGPSTSGSSYIHLCSGNYTGSPGSFYIGARNASGQTGVLSGHPDGALYWNGGRIMPCKPDIGWVKLTNVYPSAGDIFWCCKGGICYIEGYGITWAEKSSPTNVTMATGIPNGYCPGVECKGTMFMASGKETYAMCWVKGGQYELHGWVEAPMASGKGRLYLSYPVF